MDDRSDLLLALPALVPTVVAWATANERASLTEGAVLSLAACDIARSVGVSQPERIRLRFVDALPWPTDPTLVDAGSRIGMMAPNFRGLTLGHAVFIVQRLVPPHEVEALLRHEFRHVAQYERCGSIEAFLTQHLHDLVVYGYEDSPFERDARRHEVRLS